MVYNPEYSLKWRIRHPEHVKASRKRYYEKNRKKILQYAKKWRIEHPDKTKLYNKRYYERKRNKKSNGENVPLAS